MKGLLRFPAVNGPFRLAGRGGFGGRGCGLLFVGRVNGLDGLGLGPGLDGEGRLVEVRGREKIGRCKDLVVGMRMRELEVDTAIVVGYVTVYAITDDTDRDRGDTGTGSSREIGN